jgi:hypothetical protein
VVSALRKTSKVNTILKVENPEMAGFKISWFWPSTKSYYI